MIIKAGTRLGPYEVLAPIGAGGMGEVYKAKDTRLDRIVAIKVLPEHLAESPERKARFEREAKAISQLNHPHICTLYDVGEQDGIRLRQGYGGQVDFIVMEYIEGETLAERLKRGPLKLDQALEYGIQIAEALAKAHQAGIVHRDLKPGNVMLTKSGVKLLDFGLARLVEADGDTAASDAPTRHQDLTAEESIVGTLQYMAPEQLERKTIDARADIWALGAVIYEMLTGVKAFRGESSASLISSIMNDVPASVSELRRLTPPALDHLVSVCLAKDADARWQSAADVATQLAWVAGLDALPNAAALPSRRIGFWVVAASTFILGAVAMSLIRVDTEDVIRTPLHVDIALPASHTLASSAVSVSAQQPFCISRDGQRIVFAASDGGTTRLYLRELTTFDVRALNGTEGAESPFFSPNGEWVGFRAGGELRKVPVDGGVPLVICRLPAALFPGAVWLDGDVIVFAYAAAGLFRVSANGGEPTALTTLAPDERGHTYPTALPGSQNVLFTVTTGDEWFAAVASLDTGEHRKLMAATGWVWFLPPGHLVYGQGGGLLAVSFDPDNLEVRSGPVPVLDGVLTDNTSNIDLAKFTVSASGSLVYAPGALIERTLVWVDREGKKTPAVAESGRFTYPKLSPDGTRLAVTDLGSLWVYDLTGGTRTRLTTTGNNFVSRWSPDGSRLVFGSSLSGQGMNLHEVAVDSMTEPRLLLSRVERQYPIGWTPDGGELLFYEDEVETGGNVMRWSPGRDGEPEPVLASSSREWSASLSPDGKFLAYASDASGRAEVYVRPYPEPGPTVTVSTDGGTEPLWSPDGSELFYRDDLHVMVVDVEVDPSFSASSPRVLFTGPSMKEPCCGVNYDISRDGMRFLMIDDSESEVTRIHLITNWNEEVARRVATK